jgi:hypothetical protein
MKKLPATFGFLIATALLLMSPYPVTMASISSPPKVEVGKQIAGSTDQRIARHYGCHWVRRCVVRDRFGRCLRWTKFWVCPRGWRWR